MITEKDKNLLFEEFNTPPHVRRHCEEVTRVAVCLANALNDNGAKLDVPLIQGAASIHDVVRTMENHDIKGAEILEERGFPKEAELVRHHMRHSMFKDVDNLDEQDILCLADRVVKEDNYVGLDERMTYLINKPGGPSDKEQRIRKVQKKTQALIDDIEDTIGMSFEACVGKNDH